MFFCFTLLLLFFTTPLAGQEQSDLVKIRNELQEKSGTPSKESTLELLNVSYDPTREFYEAYNPLFASWWKKKTKQEATIIQSHGGSGMQARAIISGLEADVATLALAYDIEMIEKLTGAVGKEWEKRLPNSSTPYFSVIVFLVRRGNPKQIHDWGDLVRKDVSLVVPNPKTSGGAAWTYLSAWAWASRKFNNDPSKIKEFMKNLYANAPVLDSGARGATTTFVQRQSGDVLLSWENEAYLTKEKINNEGYEIIYPSLSIKAEPSVAWLSANNKKRGTEDLAAFYLKYLYSPEAQELIARHYFRPYDREVLERYRNRYPDIKLTSIEEFGGWKRVKEEHLKDDGLFDELFIAGKKAK